MSIQTSERLLANSERIMSLWETRAKHEIEAATHQDSLVLRNELPKLLTQLADALSTTIDRTEIRVKWDFDQARINGKAHGTVRSAQSGYTIDQLIFEYHILRQVIFEVMEEEVSLTKKEREIIICAIEQSVNDAATEFSFIHTKIQQELIHTLAHDLRNPITATKIISQQLERKFVNDESMLSRITKNMNRIDSMIQDLLDVGRLRAGERLPLEFNESDLNIIINNIVVDLNFIYNDRFKFISSGECIGNWSARAIQRLIENLAINAVKYGDAEKEIIISLKDTGENFLLSVHNEGAPIPINDQELLFEQYRRPRSTEKQVGWGLGLVIVEAMARAHNGTIEVDSREGKGTSFNIKFPKVQNKTFYSMEALKTPNPNKSTSLQ